jgi:hypothetical protein
LRGYDSAEKILQALEQHPGGLNMRMLLHLTGLNPSQYRNAYNWTFDNFDEPIWVRARIDKEWIYILPENEKHTQQDWLRTVKTQITRARREHSKIHAIAGKHPTIDNRLSEELARTRLEQLKIEKERLNGV